jgi:hypothetical protein
MRKKAGRANDVRKIKEATPKLRQLIKAPKKGAASQPSLSLLLNLRKRFLVSGSAKKPKPCHAKAWLGLAAKAWRLSSVTKIGFNTFLRVNENLASTFFRCLIYRLDQALS